MAGVTRRGRAAARPPGRPAGRRRSSRGAPELAAVHGLRAVCACPRRIRGRGADVERGVAVHRQCRCGKVSRVEARGTSDEAYNLRLRRGIGEARELQSDVADVVMALGALAGRAAESMRRVRLHHDLAATLAEQGFVGLVCSQPEAHRCDVLVRLDAAALSRADGPQPIMGDGVVPEFAYAADMFPSLRAGQGLGHPVECLRIHDARQPCLQTRLASVEGVLTWCAA